MIRQTIKKKTDVLTFGKFKGKTINHVLINEPSYLFWLSNNEVAVISKKIMDDATERCFSSAMHRMMGSRFMDIGDFS